MDEQIKTLSLEVQIRVSECPCGSKKAPERCCGAVRPRTHVLEIDPRNYYLSDGLVLGLDYSLRRRVGNEILPLIGETTLSHTYKRNKNDKLLVKGKSFGRHVLHPNSILTSYDNLFFIDTNTKKIESHSVSVTAVIHARMEHMNDRVNIKYALLSVLEFWDADVPPERLGWYAFLTAIETSTEYVGNKNALVVDSELNNISYYNDRKQPILGDYYLPNKFEILYASADIGASLPNKFIKTCDRLASEKMNDIKENPRKELLNITTYPCKWFRQWIQ